MLETDNKTQTTENTEYNAIQDFLLNIKNIIKKELYINGFKLYQYANVQVLAQGKDFFELNVEDVYDDFKVSIKILEENKTRFEFSCSCKSKEFCNHRVAATFEMRDILKSRNQEEKPTGKAYTKLGMKQRVLKERKQKAFSENYRLRFSNNIYGEHTLTTELAISYKLTFRDIKKEFGYCSCPDYKTNKLGTCKHLIFAFDALKKNKNKLEKLKYPFVEIYLNPEDNKTISYFYPDKLNAEIEKLVNSYFNKNKEFKGKNIKSFLEFSKEANDYKNIKIRNEVFELVEEAFEQEVIEHVKENYQVHFNDLKAELFPYQKKGVEFAVFKKAVIIADEMGLGKTLQAISTAILKKEFFNFKRTLIICPASLKDQWKNEIEKFSKEKATVVHGFPEERAEMYRKDKNFFLIINYETVLRDKDIINEQGFDFIILDEAQKIKNYETITANSIKSLNKKHALVITGTPIENKLLDLYSIIGFLDPKFLSPLWDFSYQYCYFDEKLKNKITGYYNLQQLKERISPILLRRTKKEVLKEIHKVTEITIPVNLHPKQREYHSSFARGVAKIIHKKFKTLYDWQRLNMLLQSMRMVCDSSFLVDQETNFSPKLIELKDILLEKLDLANNNRKILIFSEWTKMNHLIGKLLLENNIAFIELNGKVPIKKRQLLIDEFENNDKIQVFLSTEAGGTGLNLQVADTVINFELPWNPAKKNQRIGRIDRLGQKNENLTVINLITKDSIEIKIASGLNVKQNLFDNVLNSDSNNDIVDFSDKGRAQFLKELELSMNEFSEDNILFEKDELVESTETKEEIVEFSEIEKEKQQKEQSEKIEQLEEVMNKGMEFLSMMFKMSTGKEFNSEKNKIEIDKETGEVVMRFKMDF